MNRRGALRALAAAAAGAVCPLRAQGARKRILWLSTDPAPGNYGYEAFRRGLAEQGLVAGRDYVLDARASDAAFDALEPFVTEALALRPDVIVTQGPVVRTLRRMGTTTPVVFGFSGDPLTAGLIESFARPGTNFTGLSFLAFDLVGKRIDFVRELVPGLKRIAILANPGHPGEAAERRVSRDAAARVGLAIDYYAVPGNSELEAALAAIRGSGAGAIVVFPDAGMMRRAERVAAFARETRIPAISGWAVFTRRGNVLSYGPVLEVCFARLAWYVDRVLKGARPADLPVELPTKVELVVNASAARAIGLTVPPGILARADEVIA